MFRYEPVAELLCEERSTPDPRHRGVSFVERTWSLDTGDGEHIQLRPGAGETVEAAQHMRPQIVAETGERFWWMYEDRLYSSAEWHSPAEVMRLAEGGHGTDGKRGVWTVRVRHAAAIAGGSAAEGRRHGAASRPLGESGKNAGRAQLSKPPQRPQTPRSAARAPSSARP